MSDTKLFISYSWTTAEHEQWVLRLAEELVSSGVDVILDKWDLKKGNNAITFMEQMVADPKVTKVLMVVDRHYATKADSREGGVGTEAQIISKEVYEEQEQDKFVALTLEKNENGKPFLPIYYHSRIYIDFCEPEKYSEKYEELLRWIFDKPLHVKPPLGKPPAFLSNESRTIIPTTVVFNRAIDAIKTGKTNSLGCITDYLETLRDGIENFRIQEYDGEFDDAVVKSIDDFLPYRDEFIQLLQVIGNYYELNNYQSALHKFFENLLPYLYRPENTNHYRETDWDNFKFIVHELFLYAIATLLKTEKFDAALYLLSTKYYVAHHAEYGRNEMVPYTEFRQYLRSIDDIRNNRLGKASGINSLSMHAAFLKERAEHSGIEFRHLMQADFVLFMREEIDLNNQCQGWWPVTLLYTDRHYGAFEIFARAESKTYFEKIKALISIQKKEELLPLFEDYRENKKQLPRWQFRSFDPVSLMGFKNLATKA